MSPENMPPKRDVTGMEVGRPAAGQPPAAEAPDTDAGKSPDKRANDRQPQEDIVAYPVLTEEVGFPPSPLSQSRTAVAAAPAAGSIGQIGSKVIADLLGWKVTTSDPRGLVGALTQSFSLAEVEGHVESRWNPRAYSVQTDLSGDITGAEASRGATAKDALDQFLSLLDGLRVLDSEAAEKNGAALRTVVRSQLNDLIVELGALGGPRVERVNQYFRMLIGDSYPDDPEDSTPVNPAEPDLVSGSLGDLRDALGLNFRTQAGTTINTVADEQNLSNFRILSDFVTALAQSWINNIGPLGSSRSSRK